MNNTTTIEDNEYILENSDGSIIQLEPYHNDVQIQITDRLANIEESDEELEEEEQLENQHYMTAISSLVNNILEMMLKQQMTVLLIVILHAILNTIFTSLGFYFKEDTIHKMQTLFEDEQRAEQLYWFLTITDIITSLILYYLAIRAYQTKSYVMYQMMIKWVYFCFFVQVFLAYINKLNMLLVFLKVLTYIYSKFVAQLIKGISNLPRERLD